MKNKLIGISLFLFFLFSLLIAKFYHVQIMEGKKWEEKANRQHFLQVQMPFYRGVFWANTAIAAHHKTAPVQLVRDIQKYHLFLDPSAIPIEHKATVAKKLGTLIACNKDLHQELSLKSRNRKVAMWLDRKERDAINAYWLPFAKQKKIAQNALYFVKDYERSYPFGHLFGQVLHTVQSQKEEKTLQALPTGGLELSLNRYLKGKLGKKRMRRSPRHAFETKDILELPEHGNDVWLTTNHILQAICEEELEKGVNMVGAKSAWAVMMDPHTGEIWALAQYPYFSPKEYRKFFNDPDLIEHTKLKSIVDANEPGSVMKPLTCAILLDANRRLKVHALTSLFDPEEMVPVQNGVFPGRKKAIKDVSPQKFLDMNMALQKSSNVYVARMVERLMERLGADYYRKMLVEAFGFGERSGIELLGESAGVVPTPGKILANGATEWSVATPFSLAMGYNMQANSLQLLRAYSVIANGGYLVKPHLVKRIVAKNGAVLVENQTLERKKVLDTAVAVQTAKAMRYPMLPNGCGRKAAIEGFTACGKTGTVMKLIAGAYSEKHHVSSFIGFLPATKPAFVLIVSMDDPDPSKRLHFGSQSCAPVFKEIAQRSLEYLGISPDDPDKIAFREEAKVLQEKYEKWNKL